MKLMRAEMRVVRTRTGVATWQVTLAIALLALGFLIAAQVRAQAPKVQYTSQERPPLVQTVRDLQAEHDSLTKQIQDARKQVESLRQGGQGSESALARLNQALKDSQLAAGFTALDGPGVYVYLDDGTPPAGSDANPADYRITARDLRVLINALWRSGAEAIAINNERIVTSTAILDVGGSIVVNSAYVSGPYQLSVIGPASMWDTFTKAQSFREWMEARYGPYRLTMEYKSDPKVVLMGYAGTANLSYSRVSPAPGSSASASPSPSFSPAPNPSATPSPSVPPSGSPSGLPSPEPSASKGNG